MSDVVILRRESAVTIVRGEPQAPVVNERGMPTVIIQRDGIAGALVPGAGEMAAVVFQLNGGSLPIEPGLAADIPSLPFSGIIRRWMIVSGREGSIVVDIQRTPFDDYPEGFVSIAGVSKPSLSLTDNNEDLGLAGWGDKIVNIDDVLRATVLSVDEIFRATITLWIEKT